MAQSQKFPESIRVRIGTERREKLEEIAHERSEPGDRVTISDLVRSSIDDLLDEEESDAEE